MRRVDVGLRNGACRPGVHCEIDRIWAAWQAANPGQNPSLAGAAGIMDPWTETEVDTRDIEALGFTYA